MPLDPVTIITLAITLGTLIYSVRGSNAASIKSVVEATKINLDFYQKRLERAEKYEALYYECRTTLLENNLPCPDPPSGV